MGETCPWFEKTWEKTTWCNYAFLNFDARKDKWAPKKWFHKWDETTYEKYKCPKCDKNVWVLLDLFWSIPNNYSFKLKVVSQQEKRELCSNFRWDRDPKLYSKVAPKYIPAESDDRSIIEQYRISAE